MSLYAAAACASPVSITNPIATLCRQVVDDLIATGGSAYAAGDLVGQLGGNVAAYLFVVGLPFLKGAEKLKAPSWWLVEAAD